MTRDLDRLTARTFDVLVVGGGIYGLTIAYDAAQRGLSVALIERDDFGSGASFNHLRTIHGGLRYLQTFDLVGARESIRERRTLARIAPSAVQPMPFVLPLRRSLARGKLAMRTGFALDRVMAFDRNEGVAAGLRLPAGRVVSRTAAIRRFPLVRHHPLSGAAVWYDYVTPEPDRLTFAYAEAAVRSGAIVANYVEAKTPLLDRTRVMGMQASDRQSGRRFDVAARLTVNATGSAVADTAGPLADAVRRPLLKAMNLVTRREAGDYALGAPAPSGRNLFLVPWRGRAVFGTWESSELCATSAADAREDEITRFIAELNQTFPALQLALDEVTLVHRGVVPAVVRRDGTVTLERDERIHDHSVDGISGMLTVAGTKYTTARAVAERITDTAFEKLGRTPAPCRTGSTRLFGDDELAVDSVDSHLAAAYGPRYEDVLTLARQRPELAGRIDDRSPVIGAELAWAARQEMVVTLADALIRRTPLGALGFPGDVVTARAAEIVGSELGWNLERKRAEEAAVRRFYDPLTR
jgi:glycerol-3-phosphate dehydrogenase